MAYGKMEGIAGEQVDRKQNNINRLTVVVVGCTVVDVNGGYACKKRILS